MAESRAVRRTLDEGDTAGLQALLNGDPAIARRKFSWGNPCHIGPCLPVSYLAQARFNGYASHSRSGQLARLLLEAGAPVDGASGDAETPLITAVSYCAPEVARALIEAGANLEATGYAVPKGTPLEHAVHFGSIECVDMLVEAGASIRSLHVAAGTGDLRGMLEPCKDKHERALALRSAAVCDRLNVIDELLNAGVPVNCLIDGGTALHWAAWEAKTAAARHLVLRGADPAIRDPEYNATPLDWARHRSNQCRFAHPNGHAGVIAFLENPETGITAA